jgi:NADH-quinone oxidoreductase subunit L
MASLLQLFIWLPFGGFLVSLLIPRKKKESVLSGIAISTVGLHVAAIFTFVVLWLANDHPILNIRHVTLFRSGNVEIFISYYFDKATACFAIVGALLFFLVSVFSRFYLHREEGFKRFFNVMLLFFSGYNLLVFSGNFETLFVGWETLGICSFLLIAFYRDRYLPVKNGLKVISFFRLGDICLILAMWMSHHLWQENITFVKMIDRALVHAQLQEHYSMGIFISIMILFAAAIKSAQIPFSTWLPRAMEGPTSSSAIFYGSLSVHLGVFVLIRTFPFWETIGAIRISVIGIGLVTVLIATAIARVQSTVKTQIAYASVAQIGIMFIEVALGFHTLALIHFAGNAFLRTYQLLVSPSVLSYMIHDQFYHFTPMPQPQTNPRLKKIYDAVYILSVKEWNLDLMLYRFFWSPFKWIGRKLELFTGKITVIILAAAYGFGLYCFLFRQGISVYGTLPYLFSFLALVMIIRAFAHRGDAVASWTLVLSSQFFIALAIACNKGFDPGQLLLYLAGGSISGIIGYGCLNKIRSIDDDVDLNRYHGYAYERPTLALVFLLACLGLVAFPITPSFIGFDVLLTHIGEHQYALICLTSLSFLLLELSVLRIYARIFLGQHKKAYHPIAYRSS